MEWYYVDKGQRIGPITESQFEKLKLHGDIANDTLVWHTGMENWQPYESISGKTVRLDSDLLTIDRVTEATCTECGGTFATAEMIRYGSAWVCAACKRLFFQKLKEGVQPAGSHAYASFWIRFGAKMIDGLLLSVFNILVNIVLGVWISSLGDQVTQSVLPISLLALQVLSWAVMITYSTYFVGKFGATPGKMACRLQIVTPTGERLGYGKAFGRFWAELLSGLTFGIGYLMAVWDNEKRALHDRLCHTRVVYRN